MEDSFAKVTLAADFGAGQQADIEIQAPNALWVVAGVGIEIADIFMKSVNGAVDMRVRIMRLGTALEVSVDRGDQNKAWWPDNAVPRLLVVVDPGEGTASARASVGQRDRLLEVVSDKLRY
jgi:hypothetical protein